MKRLIALLLILCLALCGCGKSAEAPTEPSVEATSAPTNPPTDPVEETEAPTEPVVEETEPPVVYRHPLTGEVMDAPLTTRPFASTMNNVSYALPQHSISAADILYEFEVEGAATRGLALFTDTSKIGPLGSVRSARTYFNNIMASYDGFLVHVGASDYARYGNYDYAGNRGSSYDHIDLGVYANQSYRDQARLDAGYAWEHCLFTSGELLEEAMQKVSFATSNEDGYDYGLSFSETPEINGEAATSIVVEFQGGKTTTLTYNEETGLYEAAQFDQPWIDANDNSVLSFRNILVLKAERARPEGANSFYTLVGSGEGFFACDGQIVKIQWSRENFEDPFTYTLEDGTPITLGVGKSYIPVLTVKCSDPVYS